MIIDFSDWLNGVEPDQAKSKETMQFGRITLTEAEFDRYREDYPHVNVSKKLQQLAKWLDRLPIFEYSTGGVWIELALMQAERKKEDMILKNLVLSIEVQQDLIRSNNG